MNKFSIVILLTTLSNVGSVAASSDILPIQPIGKKVEIRETDEQSSTLPSQSVTNDSKMNAMAEQMISQVVDALPASKQKSLNEYIPQPTVTNNMQNAKASVDEYGRSVIPSTTTNKAGAIETTHAVMKTRLEPELSAFEKMQREMAKKFKPVQKYKLRPSDNITIPAAKYILNSVRTSFEEVKIRSTDPNVVIKIEGSFVYFTSNNKAPFNLIMFEKGVPETQVNLTIWPLDVMPAMVQVDVAYSPSLRKKVARVIKERGEAEIAQAERIRDMESELALASDPEMKNSAYEERINSIISTIAGKRNPTGFDLQTNIPDSARFPCRFGTQSETKQRLISSRQIVDVVLVKNTQNHNIVLREKDCWMDDDVIATGILNKATLKPNEQTEVYVMRDRLHYQRIETRNERPSLLD